MHRALVGGQRLALAGFGLGRLRAAAAGVEDRQVQPQAQRPDACAALEQIGQLGALAAEGARERDAGVHRRTRHADLGVGRGQQGFGLAHIGPALEQGRGQARRRGRRHGQVAHRTGSHLQAGLAGQQGQLRLRQVALALQLAQLQRGFGAFGLGLVHLQARGRTTLQAQAQQAQAFLARGQGVAAQGDLLVEHAQAEVALRHQAAHRLPHHLAGMVGGQGLGARGFRGTAQPAPEVDLEAGGGRQLEGVEGAAVAGGREVARALARSPAAQAQRGPAQGIGFTQQGFGLLDAGHGRLQVGVVAASRIHQTVERGIAEERPPGGRDGGHRVSRRRGGAVLRRQRRGGAFVIGPHRRTGAQQGGAQQRQQPRGRAWDQRVHTGTSSVEPGAWLCWGRGLRASRV